MNLLLKRVMNFSSDKLLHRGRKNLKPEKWKSQIELRNI